MISCTPPSKFKPGCCSTDNCVAQENIPIFKMVTTDGYRANSNNTSRRASTLGLALVYINTGMTGEIMVNGDVYNPAWSFNRGDIIFLNGTSISTIPPSTGFIQVVAKAIEPNILRIIVELPFLL